MFSLLHLLSYVGAMGAFLFVTLSLASGLLWLAELIEEHSRYAKAIGMRGIYAIIALHLLLLFTDSLPPLSVFFSIGCHLVYLSNFTSSWPYISLSSPRFVLSCVLVIADHFTWFYHFANKASEAKRRPRYRYGSPGTGTNGATTGQEHSFMDVAAFFGICVWAIPLFLFLSLSANDNALPNIHSGPPSPAYANGVDLSTPLRYPSGPSSSSASKSQTSLVRAVLEPILALLPRLKRRSKRERLDEGLLAPRTPVRGSPLHTPVRMNSVGGGGSGSYFPWGGDDNSASGNGNSQGASASSSSSVYGSATGSGSGMARPRTPTSQGFGNGSGSSTYGALALDLNNLSSASAGSSSGAGIGIEGLPGGAGAQRAGSMASSTPPPPRRVQSEAYVQGSGSAKNPRGIATRNGKPAIPESSAGAADAGRESKPTGEVLPSIDPSAARSGSPTPVKKRGGNPSPPRVSLGPAEGKPLGNVEIMESQTLTKRKAD